MENAIDKTYRVVRFLLDKVIGYGAAIAMLTATLLAISEVIRRYAFKVVFPWGQDAVTYGLVAAVFLYFAVTQAHRSHLRMAAVMDALKERGYEVFAVVVRTLISAGACLLYGSLAWFGVPAVERSMMMERTTQSMVILIWPFQLVLLVAFALMSLVCLFQLYQDIQALRGKEVFTWSPVEEGIDI